MVADAVGRNVTILYLLYMYVGCGEEIVHWFLHGCNVLFSSTERRPSGAISVVFSIADDHIKSLICCMYRDNSSALANVIKNRRDVQLNRTFIEFFEVRVCAFICGINSL